MRSDDGNKTTYFLKEELFKCFLLENNELFAYNYGKLFVLYKRTENVISIIKRQLQ
jgi:hypothetical protein